MEIIGLLIIVIIIVLIIFFSLAFRNRTNPNETPILAFTDEQILNNLGNVLAETTIQCQDNLKIKTRDLMINCASTDNILCQGKTACEKLNETIIHAINETLSQNLESEITITGFNNEEVLKLQTPGCQTVRQRAQSKQTPIGAGNLGTILLQIRICY